jgi:hypothetical protein
MGRLFKQALSLSLSLSSTSDVPNIITAGVEASSLSALYSTLLCRVKVGWIFRLSGSRAQPKSLESVAGTRTCICTDQSTGAFLC